MISRRRSRYERYIEAFFRVIQVLSRPNTYTIILLVTLVLLLLGTVLVQFFEQGPEGEPTMRNWNEAFVFMLQNVAGVGIGAKAPLSPGGRAVGVIFVILAAANRGLFVAAIVSGFVNRLLAQGRGTRRVKMQNHVIICGWNPDVKQIVQVLEREAYGAGVPIVLLANQPTNPMPDGKFKFVSGDPSVAADLERAGVKTARSAIVIANEGDNETHTDASDDARSVLTVLALKTANPSLHVVVEVQDPANRRHFERARADEMIVHAEMSEGLLARSAVNNGIAHVYSDLLRLDTAVEMYVTDAPTSLQGKSFRDAAIHMHIRQGSILVGVIESETPVLAPPSDYKIHSGTRLVVMSNMHAEAKPNPSPSPPLP